MIFSGLGLRLELIPSVVLVLISSDSDWNYTIDFPGPPSRTIDLETSQPQEMEDLSGYSNMDLVFCGKLGGFRMHSSTSGF